MIHNKMKKLLTLLITVFFVTLTYGQGTQINPGGTWQSARGIINTNASRTADSLASHNTKIQARALKASPVFTGAPTLPESTWKIGAVTILANGTEINTALDGILATATELNYSVNLTGNIQTQLNGKLAASDSATWLNKYARKASPQFSGTPRISTDTVATRAYARAFGGGTGDLAYEDTVSITGFVETQFRVDTAKQALRAAISAIEVGEASMVYPGVGIPLSTGSAWGTSITNNSANWNTAYGWGNWASAGLATLVQVQSIAHDTAEAVVDRYLANGTPTIAAADSGLYDGGYMTPTMVDAAIVAGGGGSGAVDSSLYVTVTRLTDSLDVMRLLLNQLLTAVKGIGIDIVAPSVSSAWVSADSLYIVMNENLQQDSVPPITVFDLTEDDVSFGFTSVSISNDTIFAVLDSTTVFGSVYLLDYTKDYPALQDSSNNETSNFTNRAVTNNTSEVEGGAEPASIQTNLLADYDDAAEYVTLTGNEVTQWSDKSGNGHHLTSEATAYPTWSASGITFDGVNDYLRKLSVTNNQPITMYMVYDMITHTGGEDIVRINSTLATRLEQSNDGSGLVNIHAGVGLDGYNAGEDLCVITVVFNGANSKIKVNNDTTPLTGDAGTRTMEEINIGAATAYGNFLTRRVIIKTGVDSAGDETEIITHLISKYSITE